MAKNDQRKGAMSIHGINQQRLRDLVQRFEVKPGSRVRLARDFDPASTYGFDKPDNLTEIMRNSIAFISEYADRLYAENAQSLLVIFQALDAAGKDSAIDHVMSGLNPAHTQVYSFKAPSAEELDHDYLWRCVKALPERGRIGIFNRSYYEEVLVVRVHPEFLKAQRLPPHTLGEGLWQQRFEEINNFERYLVNQGTQIVKIYLNVSKEEQRLRQLERIDRPEKNWKFNPNDIKERAFWDEYMAAYDEVFNHTSTPHAPWYVIPADQKWFTRIAAAMIIAHRLIGMNPQYPTVSEQARETMLELRQVLIAEGEGQRMKDNMASGKKNGKRKR